MASGRLGQIFRLLMFLNGVLMAEGLWLLFSSVALSKVLPKEFYGTLGFFFLGLWVLTTPLAMAYVPDARAAAKDWWSSIASYFRKPQGKLLLVGLYWSGGSVALIQVFNSGVFWFYSMIISYLGFAMIIIAVVWSVS